MQLKIIIDLKRELELPIDYGYMIQKIIYDGIQNQKYKQKLYTEKTFVFSPIYGNYKVMNKKIIFSNRIYFEIRSADSYLIRELYKYYGSNNIILGNGNFKARVKAYNYIISDKSVNIIMSSPICVYETLNNEMIFLSPKMREFSECINNDFYKKYFTYYKNYPTSNVEIMNTSLIYNDKRITHINGINIMGFLGHYILSGEPEYLTFLYNSGLGSMNSQEFGLFDIE